MTERVEQTRAAVRPMEDLLAELAAKRMAANRLALIAERVREVLMGPSAGPEQVEEVHDGTLAGRLDVLERGIERELVSLDSDLSAIADWLGVTGEVPLWMQEQQEQQKKAKADAQRTPEEQRTFTMPAPPAPLPLNRLGAQIDAASEIPDPSGIRGRGGYEVDDRTGQLIKRGGC